MPRPRNSHFPDTPGTPITFPLPDGRILTGHVESTDRPEPESTIASGPLADGGEFLIIRSGDLLDGLLRTCSGETWRIGPDAVDRAVTRPLPPVARANARELPPIHAPEPPPAERTFRLLVVYTIGALLDAGADRASLEALLRDEVREAGEVFRASGTGVDFELVAVAPTADRESIGSADNLAALVDPTSERFDSVRRMRDAVGADLVCLIGRRQLRERGKAFVREAPPPDFAPYAMSIVRVDMLGGPNRTLAHELAHNFGADHDVEHVESDDCSGFGHAFSFEADGRRFHTLLGRTGGEVIPRFSNPRQTLGGVPLGCPRTADNARIIRRNSVAL